MDHTYSYFIDGCKRWRKIRNARDLEIDILNELTKFEDKKNLNQKIIFNRKFILRKTIGFLSFSILLGKFIKTKLKNSIFADQLLQIEKKQIPSIVVLVPSRLVKVKGDSIEEKLKNISETKYQKGSVGLAIKDILKTNPSYLIPAFKKEKIYMSDLTKAFGSNNDLINIIIKIKFSTLVKAIPLIIKNSHNFEEIIELLLLLGFIEFLQSKEVKNILFLSSNSRTIDCILIAACVIGIKSKEYLHGVPSKFIYQREEVITQSPNNHSSVRLLPIKSFCKFSKSNSEKFLNFNFENVKINMKEKINLTKQKIVFAGGECHFKNYLESGFYRMEKLLLEIIVEVASNKFEIIYVPHPAHKIKNLRFDYPKQVNISELSTYQELKNTTHCLALISSILWEANFWGIKSMICIPNPDKMFSKEELEEIFVLNEEDPKKIISVMKEFLK